MSPLTRKRWFRWLVLLCILAAIAAIIASGVFRPPGRELVLFCAAGVQPPVDQIVQDYQREFGVHVRVQYGGSGQLLSNLEVARRGDLYLAADDSYIRRGREKGLVDESIPIAFMRPLILVAKGNPRNVRGIDDLLLPAVRLALADPDQAAIGKSVRQLMQKRGQWDQMLKKAAVVKTTVNDLANDVKVGSADAAIVWDTTAKQYPDLDVVRVDELGAAGEQVTIGVLKSANDPRAALHLARYLSARDRGLKAFAQHGYESVAGDVWADVPQIVFYSGAVNRPAVEDTVAAFEQREGCRVSRVYNGCGILVAQMRTQQKPDAYLACDNSFVTPVADLFDAPVEISDTHIVIAVTKGNPRNIKTLADLTAEGLKIGLANAEQSTLGALTKTMLQRQGIYDGVMKNVRTQVPTADTLVNQLVLGSLDAALVYEANLSQVRDTVQQIAISLDDALAVQPFAAGKSSEHKQLVGRLLDRIRSADSQKQYESLGFRFRVDSGKK